MTRRVSVAFDAETIDIDSKARTVTVEFVLVGPFTPDELSGVESIELTIVETTVAIKNIGRGTRYKLVVSGDVRRCSAVQRAIMALNKGHDEEAQQEMIYANGLSH